MKRILLVDDCRTVTDLVTRMLTATGDYLVQSTNDSREAVNATRAFLPDLIIMDVDMPNMDGGDVSSRLSDNSLTRSIPIIFLTSLCSPAEAEASRARCSTQRFLSKPVDRITLLKEVRDTLEVGHHPLWPAPSLTAASRFTAACPIGTGSL